MVGYEKYTPVNLKWQRNMGASLSWQLGWHNYNSENHINSQSSKIDTSEQITWLRFYSFYGAGYYPNNRTRLAADVVLEASRFEYQKRKPANNILLRPALRFSADYFVGYRTRLSAYCALNYDKYFYNEGTPNPSQEYLLNTNFSVGLSHTLF
jgi:hypothetical protein